MENVQHWNWSILGHHTKINSGITFNFSHSHLHLQHTLKSTVYFTFPPSEISLRVDIFILAGQNPPMLLFAFGTFEHCGRNTSNFFVCCIPQSDPVPGCLPGLLSGVCVYPVGIPNARHHHRQMESQAQSKTIQSQVSCDSLEVNLMRHSFETRGCLFCL